MASTGCWKLIPLLFGYGFLKAIDETLNTPK